MHPQDGFFGGRKIVHVVGLPQRLSGLLGWVSGLPLASPLLEQDTIAAAAVADSDEDGLVLVCDQDVFFVVKFDVIFGEDLNSVVIGCFSNTHEGIGEVSESFRCGCLVGELGKWETCHMCANTNVTIGNSHSFC